MDRKAKYFEFTCRKYKTNKTKLDFNRDTLSILRKMQRYKRPYDTKSLHKFMSYANFFFRKYMKSYAETVNHWWN